MLSASSSSAPGPSLPPNVTGELIGTLTIRLQECSIAATFARIEFWGARTFSDLHPSQNRPAPYEMPSSRGHHRSAAVEYPLVGSILGLYKYLEDASPLQVRFFGYPKCNHQPQTKKANLGDEMPQPELVGCTYIPDVCVADLLKLQTAQVDTPKTIKLSLNRKLDIVSLESNAHGSHIGEVHFELLFRVIVSPTQATQQLDNKSWKQGVGGYKSIPPQQGSGPSTKHEDRTQPSRLQLKTGDFASSSRPQLSSINNCSSNQSIMEDSIGLDSDLCANSLEEQQSLLEELLDLCNDDMTMPTIDSANSYADPYDMWISRIVANASSPPAKDFPSLESVGPQRSSVLRKVGSCKLEIDGLALYNRVANKIKGKHDFYLQYCPPPRTQESLEADVTGELPADQNPVEFIVCERFGNQTKMASLRKHSRTLTTQDNCIATDEKKMKVSLLKSIHSKRMQAHFKDDHSVRQWLDGTVHFNLFCQTSKPANHPKLPRVAMLAFKKKETSSASNLDKICIAQACLRLRDVILSDTLISNVELDLVSANDELFGEVGKIGAAVGSISVQLALHQGDKTANEPIISCSPTNSTAKEPKTEKNAQKVEPSSTLKPHPISKFLSSFAGVESKDDEPGMASWNTMGSSFCPVETRTSSKITHHKVSHSDAMARNDKSFAQCNSSVGKNNVNAPLKPIKEPPKWLDIRLNCISDLRLEALATSHIMNNDEEPDSRKAGFLQLRMSCGESILSQGKLAHPKAPHSFVNEIRSQEIIKLRTSCSDLISVDTDCSWQVPIESERYEDENATVTLHVLHCYEDCSSLDTAGTSLVGLSRISFRPKPAIDPHTSNCSWLPDIAAHGWFNVLDPKSHSSIGKVQVTISVGMLRQIRCFPAVWNSALRVQRWWRRFTTISECYNEKQEAHNEYQSTNQCVIDQDSIAKESPAKCDVDRHDDPDFDTVHAGFIAQSVGMAMERDDSHVSSPDSLFEEWSQQSLSVNRAQSSSMRRYEDTNVIAKPTEGKVECGNYASACSSTVRDSDEGLTRTTSVNDDSNISTAEENTKSVNTIGNDSRSVKNNVDAVTSERASVHRAQASSMRRYEDTSIIAKPAEGTIECANSATTCSSRLSESDEELTRTNSVNDDNIISTAEEKSKSVCIVGNGPGENKVNTVTSERTSCNGPAVDEQSGNTSPGPKSCNHFDISLRLDTISGLPEILSSWCCQRGRTYSEAVLSVSGIFISYSVSDGNAVMSQQEELHKLSLGAQAPDVRHSMLVSSEKITRDVELNLEAVISVPNYESNTGMILSQTLEFKLWFVPIITTSIDAMINGSKTMDIQSLTGCTVISIAKFQLYHLYSVKGYFKGRVPCKMNVNGCEKGDSIGYITTSIGRVGQQSSPISPLTSNEILVQSHVNQHHAVSTLKPMNLEVSFSRGQNYCDRQSAGVDPPEKTSRNKPTSKRKIEQRPADLLGRSMQSRGWKRRRAEAYSKAPNYTNEPSANPINEGFQEQDEESDTICPSEASFERDQDSDVEEVVSYRSLTSVMESLVNINSKLQRVRTCAEPKRETISCNNCLNVSTEVEAGLTFSSEDMGLQISSPKSKPVDCIARQMEPPEESRRLDTPAKSRTIASDTVKTCEKGSSPMSMAYRYADATTSPCGEFLTASSINEKETVKSQNRGPHENKRIEDINKARHPEDISEKQHADCEVSGTEWGGQCSSNEAHPPKNPSPRTSSRDFKQRLEKSIHNSWHNRKRSQEPHAHCRLNNNVTSSEGDLDGVVKKHIILKSASSYSSSIFKNRNNSMLSPILDSMKSPLRLSSQREETRIGKRLSQKNNVPRRPVILNHRSNMGFMSGDKDRLEQIFGSKHAPSH